MEVTTTDLQNWIVAIILGMIAIRVVGQILQSVDDTPAKQALLHIAMVNGIVLGLGISPNVTAAEALVNTTPAFDYRVSGFIGSLVDVATVVDIFLGLLLSYDKGRVLAVVGFVFAFIGGYLLPIEPLLGVITWMSATLVSLASPNTGF